MNPGCTAVGQAVTCVQSTSLGVNQSYTVTVPVNLAYYSPAILSNPPPPTSTLFPYTTLFRSTIVTSVAQLPDLQLLGQANGTFTQGQSASYTYTIKNLGYGETRGPLSSY